MGDVGVVNVARTLQDKTIRICTGRDMASHTTMEEAGGHGASIEAVTSACPLDTLLPLRTAQARFCPCLNVMSFHEALEYD